MRDIEVNLKRCNFVDSEEGSFADSNVTSNETAAEVLDTENDDEPDFTTPIDIGCIKRYI